MDAREYKIPKDRPYSDETAAPMKNAKDMELEHALAHLLKQEKENRMTRLSKMYNNWTQQIAR